MKIEFADLFDGLGSTELAYGKRAAELSGATVSIRGYVITPHQDLGAQACLLVDAQGTCPDCAPVPVPAIHLPGFRAGAARSAQAVRLRGRLSYGFAVAADGYASFLRLEDASPDATLASSPRKTRP